MYLSSCVLSANKPMTVSLVISLLAFVKGEAATCDNGSATIRGRCYEKEVLLGHVPYPGMLVVDFNTNVLYFSNRPGFYHYSRPQYLDLTTKVRDIIPRAGRLDSLAVDQDRGEVYIAGRHGIYKFYYNNKTAELIVPHISSLNLMAYEDKLYCMLDMHAYTLKDGRVAQIEEMKDYEVEFLAVDKDGYIFFQNSSGLFGKAEGSSNVDTIRNTPFEGNMATDVTGAPYALEGGYLYFANKEKKTLEMIGEFRECTYFAFDKDNNVICFTSDQIVRFNLNDAISG